MSGNKRVRVVRAAIGTFEPGADDLSGMVGVFYGYDGAFWGTTFARTSFQKAFGIDKMSAAHVTDASANLTSVFQAGG